MTQQLDALRASVARLRTMVEGLDPGQLEVPAYPTEWTVADVLSHLGSGAVILERRFDDAVAGTESPADFAPAVWDAWNAKTPGDKAADALVADRSFVDRVGSLADAERARFGFAMGPLAVDYAGFLGLRLNEHALHSWDVAVTFDPDARVAPDAVDVVVDNLQMITRWTGKPSGTEHGVTIRTSEPRRDLTITIGAEAVSIDPTPPVDQPDLELPAEALVRLVYGRLDPDHTPPVSGPGDLDELRRLFPGP